MASASSEHSDQPGHLPSLIRIFAVHSMGSLGPNASSCGGSESSLGAQVISLVLSCCGSSIDLRFLKTEQGGMCPKDEG